MAMYLLTVNIRDPISGAFKMLQRQVDPLAFDPDAWGRAFIDVQQLVTDLNAGFVGEPPQL